MTPLISQQPKSLSALLQGLAEVEPSRDRDVSGLSLDSRETTRGHLFLACAGSRLHGRQFIPDAVEKGAIAVAYEQDAAESALQMADDFHDLPIIPVADLRQHVGEIAARFYDHPAEKLFVVGITGTNGKTSCSQYLAESLSPADSVGCGVIGTLGYGRYGALVPGPNTTPDALTLQRQLAELAAAGSEHVVIETSSHGLDQGRVNGVQFDVAVFTNLSRDHLDYHDSMASYAHAKQQLFDMPGLKVAVVNIDDEFGRHLLGQLPESVNSLTYGIENNADIRGDKLFLRIDGLSMEVTSPMGNGTLNSHLLGRFNASNLLAVLGVLLMTGMDLSVALGRLSDVHTVPGRMQCFTGKREQPLVVVDYAHTPDALDFALQSIREHCEGKLWCVFGCGGERDTGKRPMMGAIAQQLADFVIITDDNPRHEDGDDIVKHILSGMPGDHAALSVQRDRRKAITEAMQRAGADDIILIAGKGHEDYQQVGDVRLPFSDQQTVQSLLKGVA